MHVDFERILIVDRDEGAMRLVDAVREFNQENGTSIRTIALHAESDRHAMFVREADEAFALDTADAAGAGVRSGTVSRLHPGLERVLRESGADAAWVGWGLGAPDVEVAELCERLGVVFVGAGSRLIRRVGDRIAARRFAAEAGFPVTAWSGGPVESYEEALAAARRLDFPLLLRSATTRGGPAVRTVDSAEELGEAWRKLRAESLDATGNPALFLERQVDGARRIAVQVVADHLGTVWAVGTRSTTVRWRDRHLVEEAPAPGLTEAVERELQEAAARFARLAGYRGAGTFVFLWHPGTGVVSFDEVRVGIEAAHAVTEMTTGLDLVKLQLAVARGGVLEGKPPARTGHAVEVRISAEDGSDGASRGPGRLVLLRLPTGPGLRVDRGVTEGDRVSSRPGPLVARVVAHGLTRKEALARLRRALSESVVVLSGGMTNRPFLLELIDRPEVRNASSEIEAAWLGETTAAADSPDRPNAAVALLNAAIDVDEAERVLELQEFASSAARMRPTVRREAGRTVEFRHAGQRYQLSVHRVGTRSYRILADGEVLEVQVDPLGPYERWLHCASRRYRMVSVAEGPRHSVEADGVAHRFVHDDEGVVRAPAPAVVAALSVKPGDVVAAGQRLAVLEAMKMETPVVAPFAGTVRQVFVVGNAQVSQGAQLLRLDPSTSGAAGPASGRISFGALVVRRPAGAPAGWRENLQELRQLVLGFDLTPSDARRIASDYVRIARTGALDTAERRGAEDEVLAAFGDVFGLFRRQSGGTADPLEALSTGEYLLTYVRTLDAEGSGLPARFRERLRRALRHYGVGSLSRSPGLEEALLCIFKARLGADRMIPAVLAILDRRVAGAGTSREEGGPHLRTVLDRIASVAENRYPALFDAARDARYRLFDQPLFEEGRRRVYAEMEAHLALLGTDPGGPERAARVLALVDCPQPLERLFSRRFSECDPTTRELMLEVLTRRFYRTWNLADLWTTTLGDRSVARVDFDLDDERVHVISTHAPFSRVAEVLAALGGVVDSVPAARTPVLDLYAFGLDAPAEPEESSAALAAALDDTPSSRPFQRVFVAVAGHGPGGGPPAVQHFTFRLGPDGYAEDRSQRGLHPQIARRLQLWRLRDFELERLPSAEDVYLFRGVARESRKDERLFAFAEVRDLTAERDAAGRITGLPHLERMLLEALASIRLFQSKRRPEERLHWNRVLLDVWPPFLLDREELGALSRKIGRATEGIGLEKVTVRARVPGGAAGTLVDTVISMANPSGTGVVLTFHSPSDRPIRPLSEVAQKVVRMRQRGLTHPYEILEMLTPPPGADEGEFPPGTFVELDLDERGRLVPVQRPPGENLANLVAGILTSVTARCPEGMSRVVLLGDPSREVGSVAEPECRRILGALDLAEERGIPVEWFTVSAGAKISMESGTENMDWISRVLRRLIEFTQGGGEVNVVVTGINVGAQPYWNAEATMLMHTRGILVMTRDGAMVLTGKTALDYSGSVSAEDNQGIGGYERVMGPNGQAQYFAKDVRDACRILLRHYDLTYVVPGERFPRRAPTADPTDRDVRSFPHAADGGDGLSTVGGIFSDETNPGRKRAFDIRRVMRAATDQDHEPLERWQGMRDAEIAVVWDARLGGIPVCLLGIESRPLPRLGFVATDGPEHWTAGTLFPLSSRKLARAVNAASGNRPLVILANLSGFDGSPESMRKLQLENGAEIGRAITNFVGPIVFCVVSRYHGGAFVVFSKALNDGMEVAALEGSFASVIGGAPAAAVVFSREVDQRTERDPRVAALQTGLQAASDGDKAGIRSRLSDLKAVVRSEKLGEVADEFDATHSVHRALRVGSLDRIVPAAGLRPYLIDALERGMARETARARISRPGWPERRP